MTFLQPMALAWLLIGLPIVGLYILKVRRRRQVVPTLMFWEQIFHDASPRSLWRRMRLWLSLLLQLAMVVLLATALADPAGTGESQQPRHYVVLIDGSASMQATDGEPTRFDQARRIAHDLVRSMRPQDEMTLVSVAAQVAIACGRTYHQPTLHRAIDALRPADAPADLREALRLATSIDPAGGRRRIVVISDGPGAAQLSSTSIADGDLALHRCGRDTPNVGITGFAVRPRTDNPTELQGMFRVANCGSEPAQAEVRLTLDGGLFDMVLLDVPAGGEKVHTFRHVHTGGRVLRAELTAPDALAVDNAAVAVLPQIARKRVLLVGEPNLFLQSVIAAHPWMDVQAILPADYEASPASADIHVFHEYVPATPPAGPCLFVHPANDSHLWTLGEDLANPLISELEENSPLLRHVHLRNCTFHRARMLKPKAPGTRVVRSFEHPLLISWTQDDAPHVALALDVNESDLPWRTAFPILMQNMLNALAGAADEPVSAYATGAMAEVALRGDEPAVTDARGGTVACVRLDDRLVIGPVAAAGLVTVRAGGQEVAMAFNLASTDESNIRHGALAEPPAELPARLLASLGSLPWWVLLVIGAIALSAMEWGLHQRRRID